MADCVTCELVARRDAGQAPLWDAIYRTPFWDIVHCNSTSLPGWIVLVIRRHIPSLDALTEDESVELGTLIRQVSLALKEEIGCAKTYVVQFAESQGHQHVHFHIIPRMPDMPDADKGPNIFKYLGVAEDARVDEAQMNQIGLGIRRRLTGD